MNKLDDNYTPANDFYGFIWERCEQDDQKTQEILQAVRELISEEKLEEIISATTIGRAIPLADNKIITASDIRLAIQVNAMDIAKAIADELRGKL